jgi:hypothetical protein
MLSRSLSRRRLRDVAFYGSDDGSCFGVSDPSELRKPFYRTPIELHKPRFEEGQISYKLARIDGDVHPYVSVSRELAQGFRARVLQSFSGPEKLFDTWSKELIPYSDLETKELGYVIERF